MGSEVEGIYIYQDTPDWQQKTATAEASDAQYFNPAPMALDSTPLTSHDGNDLQAFAVDHENQAAAEASDAQYFNPAPVPLGTTLLTSHDGNGLPGVAVEDENQADYLEMSD